MDITSIFQSQNQLEFLVEQYMRLEQRPLNELKDRKTNLNERKTVLSDLDTKLTTLKNKMDRFTDGITDYFATKEGSSSDTDKLTVSAGATAQLGNHSLTVSQLAVSDTRVSKQYTDSSSSFTGYVADQTFSLEVGHPTDADETNRVSVSVTVAAADFTGTDDEVLALIASAINTAMTTAVALDEDTDPLHIDNDEVIVASVVTEETGKSRLVLRSERSGYTYRMDFTDSADSLLADLQVNSASQSSGTAGGYITSVGTGVTDSALNSNFILDGLTFYRDGNSVSDALAGVTMEFVTTFATTETVTVNPDSDAVKEEVLGFIEDYNDAMVYLRSKAIVDPDTHLRGILADDLTYKDILNDLRAYTLGTVSNVSNSEYDKLFDIGIEADSTGKLSLADEDKFTTAIEANSTYVSDIFNASDGFATLVSDYLDTFVKTTGTIDSSKNNIDSQVTYLDDKIALMDEFLGKKEEQLRSEFSKLQEAMIQLSNQQAFFGSYG